MSMMIRPTTGSGGRRFIVSDCWAMLRKSSPLINSIARKNDPSISP